MEGEKEGRKGKGGEENQVSRGKRSTSDLSLDTLISEFHFKMRLLKLIKRFQSYTHTQKNMKYLSIKGL